MSDGHPPGPLGSTRFYRPWSIAPGASFALPAPLGGFAAVAGQPNIAPPRLSPREEAHALVDAFAARGGGGVFIHILRGDVARGLNARIDKPTLISQESSSLCGPSALVLNLATKDPLAYAGYVTALFERGVADVRKLHVKAGKDLRHYDPTGKIDPADWIALASLRDSENYFFDYQSVDDEFAGITLPGDLESWFKKIGYRHVVNDTNLLLDKDEKNIRAADKLYKDDYWVCLFINDKMLTGSTQNSGSMTPTHWVVLTSDVAIASGQISFDVFTWGDGHRHVPQGGALTLGHFFDDYYGYVAAKY
jgi:hypothetical protein